MNHIYLRGSDSNEQEELEEQHVVTHPARLHTHTIDGQRRLGDVRRDDDLAPGHRAGEPGRRRRVEDALLGPRGQARVERVDDELAALRAEDLRTDRASALDKAARRQRGRRAPADGDVLGALFGPAEDVAELKRALAAADADLAVKRRVRRRAARRRSRPP